jgi:UDP-N-acetylglucosamine--N-acetylmuramyl-(pentapeptide) pyrophosphoryl-undecaprenol N-acetylglucosamine transferase
LHLLEEKEKIQFILISGEKNYFWVRERIRETKLRGKVFPFLSQIHYAYAASDLVISRSGATTLSEITTRGLPSILIPYPFATNQHQIKNASALSKEGGAKIIIQEKLHPLPLKRLIQEIIHNPQLQNKMREVSRRWGRPSATRNVANLILQFAANKG